MAIWSRQQRSIPSSRASTEEQSMPPPSSSAAGRGRDLNTNANASTSRASSRSIVVLRPLALPGREAFTASPSKFIGIRPVPTYSEIPKEEEMVLEHALTVQDLARCRSLEAVHIPNDTAPPPAYPSLHESHALQRIVTQSRAPSAKDAASQRRSAALRERRISSPIRETLVRTHYHHPTAGINEAQAAWLGTKDSLKVLTRTFTRTPPAFQELATTLHRVRLDQEYDAALAELLEESAHLPQARARIEEQTLATVVGSRIL